MLLYNEEKVAKIFSEINAALKLLEDLKALSLEQFKKDAHKIASAKYNFIVAIEGMIDLCNHVITKNNFREPNDYADTFRIMKEQALFDESFTAVLMQMARFRNRLVHIYWEVDVIELHNIIQNKLRDIYEFQSRFKDIIKRK
ncbi:MAG: DUF86 domain-containing protein [Spirochaetota bacterium]